MQKRGESTRTLSLPCLCRYLHASSKLFLTIDCVWKPFPTFRWWSSSSCFLSGVGKKRKGGGELDEGTRWGTRHHRDSGIRTHIRKERKRTYYTTNERSSEMNGLHRHTSTFYSEGGPFVFVKESFPFLEEEGKRTEPLSSFSDQAPNLQLQEENSVDPQLSSVALCMSRFPSLLGRDDSWG